MLLGLNQTNCYTTFTSGKRKKTPNNNSKKSVVSEAWNPYTYEFCKCRSKFNPMNTCTLKFSSVDKNPDSYMELEYNPNLSTTLKDKQTGSALDISIFESKSKFNNDQYALHFFSKDMKTEYGFVSLSDHHFKNGKVCSPTEKNSILDKDYPELHLSGDRVEIEYLQNLEPEKINGLTELVNKYLTIRLVSNNKNPNIVCYSTSASHISNYKSGMRFLPLDKKTAQYKYFMEKYGKTDVNEVMEDLLSKNKQSETSEWSDLGMYLPRDTVIKYLKNHLATDLEMYSPYSQKTYSGFVSIELDKPKTSVLRSKNQKDTLLVTYDPAKKGTITERRTGKPVETVILKVSEPNLDHQDSYFFMSRDLNDEYGHVELCKEYASDIKHNRLDEIDVEADLYRDYPKYGIVGDRVIVEWLENSDEKHYSGIGKLADRIAVEYCIENNIQPNIISAPARDSHMAHYKRGKRFVSPNKNDVEYIFLLDKYNETNPNRILKKLVRESEETGVPADIHDWGGYVMYMPKKVIDKYVNEYNGKTDNKTK